MTTQSDLSGALSAQTGMVQSILEFSPSPVYVKDLDGRISMINRAMESMLGMPRDAVLGRHGSDFPSTAIVDEFWNDDLRAMPCESPLTHRMAVAGAQGRQVFLATKFPLRRDDGRMHAVCGILTDITAQERADGLIHMRLGLMQYAATHTLEETLTKTLDDIGELTGSPIGFYHFVDDDQQNLTLQAWSTRTMREFCNAEGKGSHYAIAVAGVWVDCVKVRHPVIHNDYMALPHRKGLPPGHAAVSRELVVPILRAGKVVAILGVGNKAADYTQSDAELVEYAADVAWEVAAHKRAEEALRASERFAEATLNALPSHIAVLDEQGAILKVNRPWLAFAENNGGAAGRTAVGSNYLAACDATRGDDAQYASAMAGGIRAVIRGERADFSLEYPCHAPGVQRWFLARVTRFEGEGPVRVAVSHLDITQRVVAQEAYRKLIDQSLQFFLKSFKSIESSLPGTA